MEESFVDNYLRRYGFQILGFKGVKYIASINESGKINDFSVEIFVDPSIFKEYELRNYRYQMEIVIRRIQDDSKDKSLEEINLSTYFDEFNDFAFVSNHLEITFKKSKTTQDFLSELKIQIIQQYNHKKNELEENFESQFKSKIEKIENSEDFNRVNKIIIKEVDKNGIGKSPLDIDYLNKSKFIRRGSPVKNFSSSYDGTIGALFKNVDDDNYYILSNWHVLMTITGEIGNKVFSNGNEIGELVWARHDSEFDMAIAKITNEHLITEQLCQKCEYYICSKPIKAKIGMKVKICGLKSVTSTPAVIRSTNAYVKLKNGRLYKNQILTDKSISIKGDSGSVLVSEDNHVLGLVFAGHEEHLTVANPLYEIFNSKIEFTIINNEYIDYLSSFTFDKFLNNI